MEKVLGVNEAGSAVTIQVKLSPDSEYDLVLTGRGFRTRTATPLQPYLVRFKTKQR